MKRFRGAPTPAAILATKTTPIKEPFSNTPPNVQQLFYSSTILFSAFLGKLSVTVSMCTPRADCLTDERYQKFFIS
jgi:hypothetical protein